MRSIVFTDEHPAGEPVAATIFFTRAVSFDRPNQPRHAMRRPRSRSGRGELPDHEAISRSSSRTPRETLQRLFVLQSKGLRIAVDVHFGEPLRSMDEGPRALRHLVGVLSKGLRIAVDVHFGEPLRSMDE